MPDKLLKDGLRTSAKIGALPEFAELLFIRLLVATCHAGRCPWNLDWIRAHALSNRPRKRLTEIAAALETLRRAHLVARYTVHDGTAFLLIPNHGQRLKHAVRSPWPAPPPGPVDVEGQVVIALDGSPPAAAAPPPEIGIEPKARVVSATHFSSTSDFKPRARAGGESDNRRADDCLDELVARYPRHDVRAQLRAARNYQRKERGEDAEVTVGWFIEFWMPKAAEKKRDTSPAPAPDTPEQIAAREAEAEAWAAEERRKIAAIVAGPEPARDTLDHAIWLQGRKTA